ncbi:MAG: NAD-binding protein [Caldilineaceae bacterium]|nr:NAD-binding protein [Caldilineaceae bacterium]
MSQTVGVIGLGAMGMGMAQSLVRAGFVVKGYDIAPAAVQVLVDAGGHAAATVAEAASGADVLIVMVVNAAQAEDVLFGAGRGAAALPAGSVVMLSCTVSPDFARRTAERLSEMGLEMLDAPVSGGPVRSAEGALSVMASGSPSVFEKCSALLDAVAANVYRMGDAPGLGSVMKSINQLLAGVHLAAMGEAFVFGAKQGIDAQQMYDVICASAGGSWMFQNRGQHILDNDYTPASAVDIWGKDLGIVLEAGKANKLALPLAAVAHQLFLAASAQGMGRMDDAAIVKIYAQLAGVELEG